MPGFGKPATSRMSSLRLSMGIRSRRLIRLVYKEVPVLLHGRFLFFNSTDIGPPRTLAEETGEIGKFIGRARGIGLDAAIVEVAHVAGKVEFGRGLLGE